MSPPVDYSVYLVTDSTMIPESSTFIQQVERAIENGVTILQLREKTLSTRAFIDRANEVHRLTKPRGIPLIINDRVDVALAVDAEGVHVGQDDMHAAGVRRLLGPNKIIGVTCSNPEETRQVCEEGVADYVGLGTVYFTNTKKDTKTPQGTGPIGVRRMLQVLRDHNQSHENTPIKSVAIGGINQSNAAKVLYQCALPQQSLDGVAVVSCIMANEDAAAATSQLADIVKQKVAWLHDLHQPSSSTDDNQALKMAAVKSAKPLVHHITNNVVKNFSANVTLAIGASPIMSELPDEYEEFAANIPNLALVINLGTPSPELLNIFIHALNVYNKHGKHIVFDPVAAGATSARLEACRRILNAGQPSVIKGNVGEISAIWKLTSSYKADKSDKQLMRGVDSIADLDESVIVRIGQEVAQDFRTVVVITGSVNYVIDGTFNNESTSTYVYDVRSPIHAKDIPFHKVAGGHPLMGSITGSGCSLGSTIASFVASRADGAGADKFDIGSAVLGAVKLYNEAGKLAGQQAEHPGSFMIKFLDILHTLMQ